MVKLGHLLSTDPEKRSEEMDINRCVDNIYQKFAE